MSDAEFECPEVAALRALAEARGWSVYTKGPEDLGVTLRGDVTLMLKRDALVDDIWSLSIDIQTEELPHDPAEFALKLRRALRRLGELIVEGAPAG